MCMEFWCGWFDHWGTEHVVRDPQEAADALAGVLEAGASVNVYMAHGGTNFSTWAGANTADPATGEGYLPTVTSYDYDAPVDERGGVTEKFRAFRTVLERYADGPLPEPEPPAPLLPASRAVLTESLRLFDALDDVAGPEAEAPLPPSFEDLGIGQGLVLYTGRVPGPRQPYPLSVQGLADRAHVYVDGAPAGVLERDATEVVPDVAVPGRRRGWNCSWSPWGGSTTGPGSASARGPAGPAHAADPAQLAGAGGGARARNAREAALGRRRLRPGAAVPARAPGGGRAR